MGDPHIALGLFSAVGVVAWAGLCLWLLREVGVLIWEISKRFGGYLIYCLPVLCLAGVLGNALSFDAAQLVAAGALFAVPYYALALRRDKALHH